MIGRYMESWVAQIQQSHCRIGSFSHSFCKDTKSQRRVLEYPPAIEELFKVYYRSTHLAQDPLPFSISTIMTPSFPITQTVDSWEFNMFEVETLTTHQPLRYIGHEVFKRHDMLSIHKVSLAASHIRKDCALLLIGCYVDSAGHSGFVSVASGERVQVSPEFLPQWDSWSWCPPDRPCSHYLCWVD